MSSSPTYADFSATFPLLWEVLHHNRGVNNTLKLRCLKGLIYQVVYVYKHSQSLKIWQSVIATSQFTNTTYVVRSNLKRFRVFSIIALHIIDKRVKKVHCIIVPLLCMWETRTILVKLKILSFTKNLQFCTEIFKAKIIFNKKFFDFCLIFRQYTKHF